MSSRPAVPGPREVADSSACGGKLWTSDFFKYGFNFAALAGKARRRTHSTLMKTLHPFLLLLSAAVGLAGFAPGRPGASPDPETVTLRYPSPDSGPESVETIDLYWDAYGVPHVFAQSDAGAYYGAGYACARLRLFQMSWHRLMYQGRLAEFFGPGTWTNPNNGVVKDIFTEWDRKVRLLGWKRYAEATARNLQLAAAGSPEREIFDLLSAYCDGVNAYLLNPTTTHSLFQDYQIPLTPWTPADCIGIWTRLGSFFSPDGLGEAAKRKTYEDMVAQGATREEILEAIVGAVVCDDSAPVVQQADVPAGIQAAMAAYATNFGLFSETNCPGGAGTPAFSEAFAVHGSRSQSGKAMLVGEPRVTVHMPNDFLEWHMKGATFEVRGIGLPGSPNLLIGSTTHHAWSLTALGMDQADLYQLETDAAHPDQYRLDGQWLPWDVDQTETLLIENKKTGQSWPPENVRYRECHWGPVVTEITPQNQGKEYARKALPFANPFHHTSIGILAMFRATDLRQFVSGLSQWSFPSANVIFAGEGGDIGYWANGHLPMRQPSQPLAGFMAQDGSLSANDWIEILPHHLLPWVVNPAQGFVHSGNHMTIGSWYPIPHRPGPGGESGRSRRLRELLEALPAVADPAQIRRIHTDAVAIGPRDTTLLGVWIRDQQPATPLSQKALDALQHLELWQQAGATMDNQHYATALAHHLRMYFRLDSVGAQMLDQYGGGESGFNFWAKDAFGRIGQGLGLTQDDVDYVQYLLEDGWDRLESSLAPDGIAVNDHQQWQAWYTQNLQTPDLATWTTLGIPDELALQMPWTAPTLISVHGGTILHQTGQSYSMSLEPGVLDSALSVLPTGQSEGENDFPQHQFDQVPIWQAGALRPSPTSLSGIQALGSWNHEVLQMP